MPQQKGIVLLSVIVFLAAIAMLILFLYEGTLLNTIESRNMQFNLQFYQNSMLALQHLDNEIQATNVSGLAPNFYSCLVENIPEHVRAAYLTTHWQNQYTKGCGGQKLSIKYVYLIEQLNENSCAQIIKQGQRFSGVRFYSLTFYSQHIEANQHLFVQTTFAVAVQQLKATCRLIAPQVIRSGWLSWREIKINAGAIPNFSHKIN